MNSEKNVDLLPIDEMDDMWKSLTQGERFYLRENTELQQFKKNELLYREGDNPTHLLCLVSGKVKIYKTGLGTRKQIIRLVRPNEIFGFRCFFACQTHSTSAAAVEPIQTYMVPIDVINQIVQSNNKIATAFIKKLAVDLGLSDDLIVSLTQKHIRGRLAETILFLKRYFGVEDNGDTLDSSFSREDIACLSNMTTSNAIRTLSNFVSEGILDLDGRRITIRDLDKLKKISKLG